MSWDVTSPDGPHAQPDPLDPVESLLARCLERGGAESSAKLEELCRDHPEHAGELRGRFAWLVGAGLVSPGADPPVLLERLEGFRLLRRLGGGGMGVVYLAHDDRLGREVALKVIRPEHADDDASRARFRREIATAALLEHPGIVPVYLAGDERGVPFFTMERVHGATLAELLADQRDKPVERLTARDLLAALQRRGAGAAPHYADEPALFRSSWPEACIAIAAQVADALHHAHERGVLHRDVKPSNVMLTADGRARLLDFGLASRAGSQRLTRSGSALGSLPYMAPEQARGEPMDRRSDVYSLAVTLYELLTLEEPFLADTPEATRARILDGRPASLRTWNRRVPWDVETVCLKALDLDPQRRYATAAAFREDLHNLLAHRPTRARRPGPGLAVRRWVQRHPTLSVAVALGALLSFGLPFGLFLQERHARQVIDAEAETARRATSFLVELFEAAGPRTKLGKQAPVSLLLDEGVRRIHTELKDQPRIRARLLETFGAMYHWMGAHAEAEALLREEIDLRRAENGSADPAAYSSEALLADVLTHQGKYEEALARTAAALESLRTEGGNDAHLRADLLTRHGIALHHLGRVESAEAELRESVRFHRELPGRTSCGSSASGLLGTLLVHSGRNSEGLALLRGAVEDWRSLRPLGHPSLVQALLSLADAQRATGELAPALDTADAALRELERIDGLSLEVAADAQRTRAEILDESAQRPAAEAAFRDALRIYAQMSGPPTPDHARCRLEFGRFLFASGEYEQALAELERSLELLAKADFRSPTLSLKARTARASTLAGLGRVREAAEEAQLALDEAGDGGQVELQDLASAGLALSWARTMAGDIAGAESALCDASVFVERADAPLLTAVFHLREAFLCDVRGDGAAAEAAAIASLESLDSVRGGPFVEEAQAWNLRGWARSLLSDDATACDYLQRSVDVYDRVLPDGHPDVARVLELLGVLRAKHDPPAATVCLERALAVRRRFLRADDPLLVRSIHNLGAARTLAGRDAEAEPLLEEAIGLESGAGVPPSLELVSDLYFAATIRLRAGDSARAIERSRRSLAVLDSMPRSPAQMRATVELLLARALLQAEGRDEARALLEALCAPARAPQAALETRIGALDELALLYEGDGRAQDAADCRRTRGEIGAGGGR